MGEGGRCGKGRRRGGAVLVDVRNRGGIGFGEIGIWEFRELGNFLGGGSVFIIIVLEAALPVENMCELDFFFFFFRQEWLMVMVMSEEEEDEYDTRVGRRWWLESRSTLLTLDL